MGVYTAGDTENPEFMVIFLHGYGANGQDLISLGQEWAPHVPRTVFIAPDAPTACDMMPMGYEGAYQWFSLNNLSPLAFMNGTLDAGARSAAPWIVDFVAAQQRKFKIPNEKLVLCGFSQGTMMALYIASRYAGRIGGVLGYSGALLGDKEWAEIAPQTPPVCLVHGIADHVVPVAAYYHAADVLKKYHFPFEGHVLQGLMHGIDVKAMQIGHDFLARVFEVGRTQKSA